MALAQLGIRNNYSKQPFLMKSLRELWQAQSRMTQQTESRGHLKGFGEADLVLQDQQNPVSWALKAPVFILFMGGGATPGHRLCMHEPWITQAHGPALTAQLAVSTDLVYSQGSHWQCQWVGGYQRDGKTSSTRISVTHMSRWNELRSSSTAPFFGRSTSWSGGEACGRCKEQYSTVHECCSTCLSNYGSCTRRCYIMAPRPQKAINTRVPSDSGRFSRSGVHRIGNPGIIFRPQTQPRVVPHPWDLSRSLDDLYNKLIL